MPRRPGRKDHTLLRDEQLQESLLHDETEESAERKDRATVFRLLGLAKKEAWVWPSGMTIFSVQKDPLMLLWLL